MHSGGDARAQVGSRTLKQQAEPTVVFKMDTVNASSQAESVLLQTDPTTLAHVTRELEAAIKQKTKEFEEAKRRGGGG